MTPSLCSPPGTCVIDGRVTAVRSLPPATEKDSGSMEWRRGMELAGAPTPCRYSLPRACLGLQGPHGLFQVEALTGNFLRKREPVRFYLTF